MKKWPQITVFLITTSDSRLDKPLRKSVFPPQAKKTNHDNAFVALTSTLSQTTWTLYEMDLKSCPSKFL